MLKGRTFVEADREDSRPVVIVDEELAARFWPQGSALGARIAFEDDARPDAVWREVVGIVGGVRQETLDKSPQFVGTVYIPLAQFPNRAMSLVVRTRGTPESTRCHLRLKLQEIDPELAFEAEPLSALIWGAQAERRSPTILLGAMACLAVVLALVGLYGVTSFVVGQRTAEIGLRMALGATRAFLFGIAATDPWTYLVVAALFVSAAGLAGLPPASRASRVEPHVALKTE